MKCGIRELEVDEMTVRFSNSDSEDRSDLSPSPEPPDPSLPPPSDNVETISFLWLA